MYFRITPGNCSARAKEGVGRKGQVTGATERDRRLKGIGNLKDR